MQHQNSLKRIITTAITGITILLFLFIVTAFSVRKNRPEIVTTHSLASGYMPQYKMMASDVKDVVSGWAFDKRVVFQFILHGSDTSKVDITWYLAKSMEEHGSRTAPKNLTPIEGSSYVTFQDDQSYILGNNYMFVGDFKKYIKSLTSEKFDYLLFTPTYDATTKYVYFKIRAHYPESEIQTMDQQNIKMYDAGFQTQPSPPANAYPPTE